MDVFLFFFFQITLCVLAIVLILELGRLGTYIFYTKDESEASKNPMLKPIVGKKMFALKNIMAICILLPTMYLCFSALFGKIQLSSLNIPFILAFYSLAFISFFLISIAEKIRKNLPSKLSSRKKAKTFFLYI